jgi:hypothetical protein
MASAGTLQAEVTADVGQLVVAMGQAGQAIDRAADRINAGFERMRQSSQRAGVALQTTSQQGARAGANLGQGFQQAGFQIQDFLVQVQGGGSIFTAFAQQGSQLASAFAGGLAGLGVAAAAMAAQFLFAGDATKTSTDTAKTYADAMEELNTLIQTQVEREKALTAARINGAKAAAAIALTPLQLQRGELQKQVEEARAILDRTQPRSVTLGDAPIPLAGASPIIVERARKKVAELESQIDDLTNKIASAEGGIAKLNGFLVQGVTPPGLQERTRETRAETERLAESLDQVLVRLRDDEASRAYADTLREAEQVTRSVQSADERYAETLANLNRLRDAGVISAETYARATQQAADALNKGDLREISAIFDRMSSSIADAALDLDNASDAAKNFFKAIAKGILETAVIRPAVDAASKGVQSIFGSLDLGSIFGSIFGGARANGGPVAAGRAYLVGERGPELFLPGAGGSIVPNEAIGGGGGGVVVNVDARGSAAGESGRIAAAVNTAVQLAMAKNQDELRRSSSYRSAIRRI